MASQVRAMQRTSVDGVQLEFEQTGSGDAVVFIHGSFGPDAYVPLMREAALTGYRLIRYRRRGYEGSSPLTGAVSIAEQAADCAALLRKLGVKRAHVVGHSYGGVIALRLARDEPNLVHSLVLMEPALFLLVPSGQAMMQQMAPVIELYGRGEKAAAVEAFLQAVGGPNVKEIAEHVIPGSFDQAVRSADTFFRIEMPALQAWTFTAADGSRITQPVLYVLGSDPLPPFADGMELTRQLLPQTDDITLPPASHLASHLGWIENPGEAARALAKFFAAHPMHVAARSDRT